MQTRRGRDDLQCLSSLLIRIVLTIPVSYKRALTDCAATFGQTPTHKSRASDKNWEHLSERIVKFFCSWRRGSPQCAGYSHPVIPSCCPHSLARCPTSQHRQQVGSSRTLLWVS